jgi:hypothetical protein
MLAQVSVNLREAKRFQKSFQERFFFKNFNSCARLQTKKPLGTYLCTYYTLVHMYVRQPFLGSVYIILIQIALQL